MRKSLLLLSTIVFSSCGDLLLNENLISERKVVPGFYHNLYTFGQFSDQFIVSHNKTTFTDVKPLGNCEEALKNEQEFYVSDFEGNFQAFTTNAGMTLENWAFTEIKGQKIGYNRFANISSNNTSFRYQVLSSSMQARADFTIPLSTYIPDGFTPYHTFEVYPSDLSDFKVLASLSNDNQLIFYQMEIEHGQIKSFLLSKTHDFDKRWNTSKLFASEDSFYFMISEYRNTGKTVVCHSLDFNTGKIETKDTIKIPAGGSTDLFHCDNSPAFLALINNKSKIVKFNKQKNDFEIIEIEAEKNIENQSLRKVGSEEQTPIIAFKLQNGEKHAGVLQNHKLHDYGVISPHTHQYLVGRNHEILAIENVNTTDDKSQVWLHHMLPNTTKSSRLLYEGVGFRRSCLWD